MVKEVLSPVNVRIEHSKMAKDHAVHVNSLQQCFVRGEVEEVEVPSEPHRGVPVSGGKHHILNTSFFHRKVNSKLTEVR